MVDVRGDVLRPPILFFKLVLTFDRYSKNEKYTSYYKIWGIKNEVMKYV